MKSIIQQTGSHSLHPSVGNWLSKFMNAEIVLGISFHGAVFYTMQRGLLVMPNGRVWHFLWFKAVLNMEERFKESSHASFHVNTCLF